MSLQAPRLDDLKFQQIVDELKSRIPLYCPEWTDHNVSDPGITLIELFAYVAEQLLYRMNRMPQQHYLKFANFLGVPVPTPQPARVPVTFWLSKPLTYPGGDSDFELPIGRGTQVSTTQTETKAPVKFTIERDARIVTPRPVSVRKVSRESGRLSPALDLIMQGGGVGIDLFSSLPNVGDHFDFYFDNDISQHILELNLELEEKRGTDIRIDRPPVVWEAFTEDKQWERIRDVEDGTKGLNTSGLIRLYLPKLARLTERPGVGIRFGIRVRVEQREYSRSPHLQRVKAFAALGITVDAAHLEETRDEFLGVSDGAPGQRFSLRHSPIILPLEPDETLQVGDDKSSWRYVENFAWPSSGKNGSAESPARCFTIDVMTNEICLPPAIQRASGETVVFGALPERGTALSFTRYRHGGGVIDLPGGALNLLDTSIPYVDRVENRQAVLGGQEDSLSLDALRMEAQRYLRVGTYHRAGRAVTAEDFESLILTNFPDAVGKVECRFERLEGQGVSPVNSDQLTLYVTAKIPAGTTVGDQANPVIPDGVIAQINELLYRHRLLATRVRAANPQLIPLDAAINVTGVRDTALEEQLQAATAAYLNPIHGGDDGVGWPLDELCPDLVLHGYLEQVFPGIELRTVAIEARDPRALFSVGADKRDGIVAALAKGDVSAELVDAFAAADLPLPKQMTAKQLSAGDRWEITDTDGERAYLVRSLQNRLIVYTLSEEPSGATLFVPRSVQINFE